MAGSAAVSGGGAFWRPGEAAATPCCIESCCCRGVWFVSAVVSWPQGKGIDAVHCAAFCRAVSVRALLNFLLTPNRTLISSTSSWTSADAVAHGYAMLCNAKQQLTQGMSRKFQSGPRLRGLTMKITKDPWIWWGREANRPLWLSRGTGLLPLLLNTVRKGKGAPA